MRGTNSENYLRTRLAEHYGCLKVAIEKSLESGADSEQIPFLIASYFNKHRETTAVVRAPLLKERIHQNNFVT
jgi:hypothetical protein